MMSGSLCKTPKEQLIQSECGTRTLSENVKEGIHGFCCQQLYFCHLVFHWLPEVRILYLVHVMHHVFMLLHKNWGQDFLCVWVNYLFLSCCNWDSGIFSEILCTL